MQIQQRRGYGTGVIGLLKGGKPGRTLCLRSDIDALPVREETGLPFASENEGVMHACGHDGHISCLLTTAAIMARHIDEDVLPKAVEMQCTLARKYLGF